MSPCFIRSGLAIEEAPALAGGWPGEVPGVLGQRLSVNLWMDRWLMDRWLDRGGVERWAAEKAVDVVGAKSSSRFRVWSQG